MTLNTLKQLHEARMVGQEAFNETLQQLGGATEDNIVSLALSGLNHKDKNTRVLMLRVLAYYPSASSAEGILKGLNDKERRVRQVAIQISRSFSEFPALTNCLFKIIQDENEKSKLRQQALASLAGVGSEGLSSTAVSALAKLFQEKQYRQQILLALTQLDLNKNVESLLKDIARSADETEKNSALKALGGYKVINLGSVDEITRASLRQNNELAFGSVWYWVKRSDY